MRSRVVLCTSVGLLILFAFLAGMVIGKVPRDVPATVITDDIREGIPVVRIDGITGNTIVGSVSGTARVFLSGRPVLVESGSFRLPSNVITRAASGPVTGTFVASKRGKKYYPIGSPSAEKLSPANRVYFQTAQEAEKAGYHK
jgi:hypothetical protein